MNTSERKKLSSLRDALLSQVSAIDAMLGAEMPKEVKPEKPEPLPVPQLFEAFDLAHERHFGEKYLGFRTAAGKCAAHAKFFIKAARGSRWTWRDVNGRIATFFASSDRDRGFVWFVQNAAKYRPVEVVANGLGASGHPNEGDGHLWENLASGGVEDDNLHGESEDGIEPRRFDCRNPLGRGDERGDVLRLPFDRVDPGLGP